MAYGSYIYTYSLSTNLELEGYHLVGPTGARLAVDAVGLLGCRRGLPWSPSLADHLGDVAVASSGEVARHDFSVVPSGNGGLMVV